jgi:hypothetical protein
MTQPLEVPERTVRGAADTARSSSTTQIAPSASRDDRLLGVRNLMLQDVLSVNLEGSLTVEAKEKYRCSRIESAAYPPLGERYGGCFDNLVSYGCCFFHEIRELARSELARKGDLTSWSSSLDHTSPALDRLDKLGDFFLVCSCGCVGPTTLRAGYLTKRRVHTGLLLPICSSHKYATS